MKLERNKNQGIRLGIGSPASPIRRFFGFTLIELMVVVGIMAIVMTIAIPSIYRRLHPDSMQKTVSDVLEACSHARAHAVLNARPMALVIRAEDGTISVTSAGGGGSGSGAGITQHRNRGVDYVKFHGQSEPGGGGPVGGGGASVFSARLADSVAIEAAEVNFFDIMDMEEARVRFYPNGTCDEFKMILFRPESGERREITLEITTGLADVESDPQKFK